MTVIKRKILSAFIATALFTSLQANAILIELNSSATTVGVGDTFTVTLDILDIDPAGAVTVHSDLFFDESVLSLNSAVAGDFFSNNGASVWADLINFPVATGAAVDTTVTSAVVSDDVLGIDFVEFSGTPSLVGGTLVVFDFSVVGVGDAGFSLNDVLSFNTFGQGFTDFAVNAMVQSVGVAEPHGLSLLAAGGLLLVSAQRWRRRRAR